MRVTLVPRYPLFGGWSSTFTFGYSLPLSSAVGKVRVTPTPSCSRAAGRVAALSMLCCCRAHGAPCRCTLLSCPVGSPGTLLPSTVCASCPPNNARPPNARPTLCLPSAGAQDGARGVCGPRGPRPGRPGGGLADRQGGGMGKCASYFGECASHLGDCSLLGGMCTLVGSGASGGRRRPEAALHRPYLARLHAWWMRGLPAARLACVWARCLPASTPPSTLQVVCAPRGRQRPLNVACPSLPGT